jgi:hypothetical protein
VRGLADLKVLADLVPATRSVHGSAPTSIGAGIYGLIANIYFYDIETPLSSALQRRKISWAIAAKSTTVMRGRAQSEAKSKLHSEGGPSGSPE